MTRTSIGKGEGALDVVRAEHIVVRGKHTGDALRDEVDEVRFEGGRGGHGGLDEDGFGGEDSRDGLQASSAHRLAGF
jgi:hypothetical protein